MFQTIQSKMVVIFLAFTALLAASGAATYMVLTQQSTDAVALNLVGRQRMLTQKMTKETMLLVNATASGQTTRVSPLRDGLKQTMRVFESTLIALKDGGPAPINLDMTRMRELPAPESEEIRRQIEVAVGLWQPFKKNLERVLESSGSDRQAIDAVADGEDKLLTEMNTAVSLMQAHSEKKVQLLYKIQSAALAAGLLLVVLGAWIARTLISKPIADLSHAAREMSTGNLKIEFRPAGSIEVRELGASFDRMRASMLAALGGSLATADDDV